MKFETFVEIINNSKDMDIKTKDDLFFELVKNICKYEKFNECFEYLLMKLHKEGIFEFDDFLINIDKYVNF